MPSSDNLKARLKCAISSATWKGGVVIRNAVPKTNARIANIKCGFSNKSHFEVLSEAISFFEVGIATGSATFFAGFFRILFFLDNPSLLELKYIKWGRHFIVFKIMLAIKTSE